MRTGADLPAEDACRVPVTHSIRPRARAEAAVRGWVPSAAHRGVSTVFQGPGRTLATLQGLLRSPSVRGGRRSRRRALDAARLPLRPPGSPALPSTFFQAQEPRLMTPSLVLVVDDFEDARELYCTCLEQAGYRTAEARNGLEAVERAIELRPDVVLLDLAMPVLDGIEAARRLKADERTRDARLI